MHYKNNMKAFNLQAVIFWVEGWRSRQIIPEPSHTHHGGIIYLQAVIFWVERRSSRQIITEPSHTHHGGVYRAFLARYLLHVREVGTHGGVQTVNHLHSRPKYALSLRRTVGNRHLHTFCRHMDVTVKITTLIWICAKLVYYRVWGLLYGTSTMNR